MYRIPAHGVKHRNPCVYQRPQMFELLGFWSVSFVSNPLLQSGREEISRVIDLSCRSGNTGKHWVSLLLLKMPRVSAFKNLLFLFLTDNHMYRIWVGLGSSTKWLFGCRFCIKIKQNKQHTKEPEYSNHISIRPKVGLKRHFPQRNCAYFSWEKESKGKPNQTTEPSPIRGTRTNRVRSVRTHPSLPLFASYLQRTSLALPL